MDNSPVLKNKPAARGIVIYALFWLAALALYLPAARAGWVIDATGWLYNIRHESFPEYINRTHSHVESLYQFTQLITWVFYQLWGANVWAWSLLYISLHALNAFLLFDICHKLLIRTGIKNAFGIAITGAALFVAGPYVSEAVIWKACYHYLQGMLFLLLIVHRVQAFQAGQRNKYPWLAAAVFLCSAFSLEIFYLTPVFVVSMALYYRLALNGGKPTFRATLIKFLVPQVVIIVAYFLVFFGFYHSFRPHVHNVYSQAAAEYLSKPLKYLFHIVFLGRFFTPHIKDAVYKLCEASWLLITFYAIVAALTIGCVARFKKMSPEGRGLALVLAWALVTLALLMPLPFPDSALLVFYDRYCYFTCGFVYVAISLLLFRWVGQRAAIALMVLYGMANIYFTIKVNTYWKHSAYVTNRLLHDLPAGGDKTIILLNLPENMCGVPMIGAEPGSEYKAMRDMFVDTMVKNAIYDAMSFNMTGLTDGAHVKVMNDSTIDVTLNQWGTWWWYDGHGGHGYECADYRIDLKDIGRWYEITLKGPAAHYLLLYQAGGQWKQVDMGLKDAEQW